MMPYIVTSKNGSNHQKIEGVFQEEASAKFFMKKLELEGLYRRYFLEHHEFKDWCPEISKFVLSGKAS
jgi:hypothetical protein